MKLVDVNLLLYAVDEASPHHEVARPWLEEALSGAETVGLAWSVLLAFLRLSTNPRMFESPLSLDRAFDLVRSWLGRASVAVVEPTSDHLDRLQELLRPLGSAGNLTMDAHLAALALEHGAELCSADADFSRFPGVRWINPLRHAV